MPKIQFIVFELCTGEFAGFGGSLQARSFFSLTNLSYLTYYNVNKNNMLVFGG